LFENKNRTTNMSMMLHMMLTDKHTGGVAVDVVIFKCYSPSLKLTPQWINYISTP